MRRQLASRLTLLDITPSGPAQNQNETQTYKFSVCQAAEHRSLSDIVGVIEE